MRSLSRYRTIRNLKRDLITHPSAFTRGCAALSLGQLKDSSVLEPLVQALGDTSPWVRGWSAFSLRYLQDPTCLLPLCRLLGDKDEWVRQQTADTLMRFDSDLVDEVLKDSMRSRNSLTKSWALHVMASRGNPTSAMDIVPMLEDENRPVRLSAVRALYRLGQTSSIAPVRMFIRDPDDHLRGAAAYALGALGDKDSVSALCLALTDQTPWVRRNAAWSLLQLGEGLQLVASMIRDPDAGVRTFAQEAQNRL